MKCRNLYQGARCCKEKGHDRRHQANNSVSWEICPICQEDVNTHNPDGSCNTLFLEGVALEEKDTERALKVIERDFPLSVVPQEV